VIQGKFISASKIDGGPIQEVLTAWLRIQKLDSLQKDCNERLKKKIEAIRTALDEDYRVEFELVTTGALTQSAQDDLKAFAEQVSEFDDLSASLHLIDTESWLRASRRRRTPYCPRWSIRLRLIRPRLSIHLFRAQTQS
jgi:hypothetical protein